MKYKLVKKRRLNEYLLYSLIITAVIAIDVLTKRLAVVFLQPIGTQPIFEGVLHLTYHENTGAAFGMLKDAPWVFNTISTVAITAMLLYLYLGHVDSKLQAVSVAMIIAGGIGNMIERISLGYVVDFIDFRLISFPIFNGADSFVCIGAGLLILGLVLEIVKDAKNAKGGEK